MLAVLLSCGTTLFQEVQIVATSMRQHQDGALNFERAVDSYGAQAHERVEVEDTVVATLRFENGALGRLNPCHCEFVRRPVKMRSNAMHDECDIEQVSLKHLLRLTQGQ